MPELFRFIASNFRKQCEHPGSGISQTFIIDLFGDMAAWQGTNAPSKPRERREVIRRLSQDSYYSLLAQIQFLRIFLPNFAKDLFLNLLNLLKTRTPLIVSQWKPPNQNVWLGIAQGRWCGELGTSSVFFRTGPMWIQTNFLKVSASSEELA